MNFLRKKENILTGKKLLLLFFALIYLINPFITVLCLYFYAATQKSIPDSLLKLSCFLLALFIGCINSTHYPYNVDLIWYMAGYLDARWVPFKEYVFSFGINGTGKELAFPLFNYIVYSIIGPCQHGYIMIHAFFCYSLLNMAVYKFGKAIHLSPIAILTSVFLMTFIPFIFTMSIVIMRQFLAGSILLYILVEKFLYNKKCWVWMVIMVLVHSSSFFFLPFIFIPFFSKAIERKSIKYYFIGVIGVLLSQYIAKFISPFLGTNNALGYAAYRLAQGTTFEIDALSPFKIMVSIFIAIIPLWVIYYKRKNLKDNPGIIHFSNVLLVLVLFIVANLNQVEMSGRFNVYVWQFAPCAISLILYAYKESRPIYACLTCFVLIFFIYHLEAGHWDYKAVDHIYTSSLFHYILK